jgi:hypothetical protein
MRSTDDFEAEVAWVEQGSVCDATNSARAMALLLSLYRGDPEGRFDAGEHANALARRLLPFAQVAFNQSRQVGQQPEELTAGLPSWLAGDMEAEFLRFVEGERALDQQRARAYDLHLALGGSEPD